VYHNYLASTQATSRTNYYVAKITHNLTENQTLNASYPAPAATGVAPVSGTAPAAPR